MNREKSIRCFRYSLILLFAVISISLGQSYRVVGTNQTKFYNATREIASPQKGEAFYGQDAHHESINPSYVDNDDGTEDSSDRSMPSMIDELLLSPDATEFARFIRKDLQSPNESSSM